MRIALALLGVLLIAAAGVVRFAVLPAAEKLPADTNTTNVYQGTARVLLNQAALAPGSTAPLLLSDLPLQIKETVRVLNANGSAAVVDYRVTGSAAGTSLPGLDNHYAVNRTTLAPTASISGSGLTAARGLTVSFPIGTARQDYTGWVQDTGKTTTLRFAGTATSVPVPTAAGTRSYALGFETYVFDQKTAPALITDTQELASLPRGVPKADIPALVGRLHLPAAEIARLGSAFAKLPNVIPLAYTYASNFTYWVSPRDGVVVDLQATETRAVELPASLLGVAVPIATVSLFVYSDSPQTLQATIHEARNDSSALNLLGTTVPLLALIVGFVLLVATALLRRRRPGEGPPPESAQSSTAPAGQGPGI
ncbi:MAG: porin PorA family protein [Acidimicrobiales bacterium]